MIYLAVAAAAIILMLVLGSGTGNPEYVEITAEGATHRYPLDKNAEIAVTGEGYTLVVVIKDRNVCVKDADCPDKLCVATGKITQSGKSIVCVPARVSVRLTGGKESSDAVAG